ncbi:transglycosylase domain-containing protein [Flavobacterium sp. FZUC8N2.13]|uniref:Transglycosylase domain-containing protein n=1 Tax=Flavobacterium zubiriense TaxID=3138075 RepID=A0ABV4TAM1_9FLAO
MIFKEIQLDLDKIKEKINSERKNINEYSSLANLNNLVDFLVIGEDRRFYKHRGFDIIAIIRAIRNRLFYNKKEGASTIEQQLVRVLTNQYRRTLKRKIKEIILATKLKKILSKKEIALLYLKLAYFGTEKQGLENTLRSLNLNLNSELSDLVCASIIARLKYPEPKSNSTIKLLFIKRRTDYIIEIHNKHGKYY